MRTKSSKYARSPVVPFYEGSPLARYEVQFDREEAWCVVPDRNCLGMYLPGFEFRARARGEIELYATRHIAKDSASGLAFPAQTPTPWSACFDTRHQSAKDFACFQTACLDLLKNRFYLYRQLDDRAPSLDVTSYVDEIAAVVECLSKLLYPLVKERTAYRFSRGFLSLYTEFLRSLEEYEYLRGSPIRNTRLFRTSLLRFFVPGQLAKLAHQYHKCLPEAENTALVSVLNRAGPLLLTRYTALKPPHPDAWVRRLWLNDAYYKLTPARRLETAQKFAASLTASTCHQVLRDHPHATLCAVIGLYRRRLRA